MSEYNTMKEKEKVHFFYMMKKVYPMCFKSNPAYYILNHVAGIFHGLSDGAIVLITQVFFDSVYNGSSGLDKMNRILITFILYIIIYYMNDILHTVTIFMNATQRSLILGYMMAQINNKAGVIDPVEYENHTCLDDINKAVEGAGSAIHFNFSTVGVLTHYLPYFLFIGFYLYSLKPMLIVSLLLVFIPVLTAQILRSTIFAKLEDDAAPYRRELAAYHDAMCGKDFYKETRNLGSFGYLKNLLMDTVDSLNHTIWQAHKRSALIDFGFNTLSLMGYGGILFLLIKYLLAGEISVGAFAAVYNSIGRLFSVMEQMIGQHLGQLADTFGQIRNFLGFLDMPEDDRADIAISKKAGITASNASFKYPNAAINSLQNINLEIKPGETIAIVGENGAGKTTLVKLLTGLYKPTAGSVKIGETDVDTVSYKSLFENVTGVFQKYQRYAFSLRENIMIADFQNPGSDDKVHKLLTDNQIDKNNEKIFPQGLDTMLSREFDGVDLSGGQWQRLAIARGFYRESDIIVLDEPTASIDPIEESTIYKRFVKIAENKTAIIVTHRMGSARIADRIVVMKAGKIVEIGSHEELLKRGKDYANMYAAQSSLYLS